MAKRSYLIVDGYNILHSWPELIKLMTIDLESARRSLIDTLAEYSKSSGVRVYLVFDAYDPRGKRSQYEKKGIQVIFTQENETADQYIERFIDGLGKKTRSNEIRVATSDGMIQSIVLGRGATRVSASELKQIILDQKAESKRIGNKINKKNNKNLVSIEDKNLEALEEYMKKLQQD